jgi:signal transduction histidine kinase
LGRIYLPIALVIASVGPILIAHLSTPAGRIPTADMPVAAAVAVLELFPTLSVPLVIVAWQYNFRSVILFSLGTVLLDLPLALWSVGSGETEFFYFVPILGLRTLSFLVVGYMVTRLMTTQRQQRRSLIEANVKLTHYAATLEHLATSRERNRLARELHDTLAHTLSAVAVQLEGISALWESDPAQARAMLDRSLDATRTGLTETRRALQALRSTPLEDLGLALAIRQLADSVAERSRLTVDVQAPERLDDLAPDVEQGVYRVAQEALENAVQHAQARRVQVRLEQQEVAGARRLTLTVADDGAGFDPAAFDNGYHLGLRGMRERAEMVGGTLDVESVPGQGTTVRLTVEDRR